MKKSLMLLIFGIFLINFVLASGVEHLSINSGEKNYEINFISATDTSAMISVNNEIKEVLESNSKLFGDLNIYLNSADENTAEGINSVIITISSEKISSCSEEFCNLYDFKPITSNFNGGNYEVALVSCEDTSATVSIDGDIKKINEDNSKNIGNLKIYLQNTDYLTYSNSCEVTIKISEKQTFSSGIGNFFKRLFGGK